MAASLRKYSEQYKLAVPRAQGSWCRDIPFEQWLIDKIEALESFRDAAEQLNERLEPEVVAMRRALQKIEFLALEAGQEEIATVAVSALRSESEVSKPRRHHDHPEHTTQVSG